MRPLIVASLAAACAGAPAPLGPPEPSPWEGQRRVPNPIGCGDIVLAGSAQGDTQAIFVHAGGFAQRAHDLRRTLRGRATFPSADVSAHFQVGTDLTSATCVGIYPFPGPVVDREWQAVSGTVDMVVTPDLGTGAGLPFATVDAVLRDVLFVDASSGASFTVPLLRFDDVGVGFWPP